MVEKKNPLEERFVGDGLADFLLVLIGSKRLIAFSFILSLILAIGVVVFLPNIFSATARIYFPQKQNGSSAIMAQLGGLSGAADGLIGLKSQNELYVGMLQSRSIQNQIIKQYKLKDRYEKDTMVDTRKNLEDATSIVVGRDGIINISFEDKDPVFAANIVNAYVQELDFLTQRLALSDASQRRLFYEKQLDVARDKLSKSEFFLKKTQESSGLIQLDAQVQLIIQNIASIKANIAAKNVQLQSMRAFATDSNPDIVRIKVEIAQLEKQLSDSQNKNSRGGGEIASGSIPERGLDFVRKYREVKFNEAMLIAMEKQYELAKVDEANGASIMQIIDHAIAEDKKVKPARALIVIFFVIIGLVFGVFIALLKNRILGLSLKLVEKV